MPRCDNVLGTASDVIVLGIEIIPGTVENLPSLVSKALESGAIQKALQNVLEQQAKSLQREAVMVSGPHGSYLVARKTGKDAMAPLEAIGKSVGKGAEAQLKREFEATREVRDLKKRASDLECSVKKSPVGIWLDENKSTLYIVAAGLGLAGAAAMYATRTGDTATELLLDVLPTPFKFKPVGSLEIGLGVAKFKPSTRHIDLKTFAVADWKPIKAKLELRGVAMDKKLEGHAKAEVIYPINSKNRISVIAKGAIGGKEPRGDLAVKWVANPQDGLSFGLEGAMWLTPDAAGGHVAGSALYKLDDLAFSASAKHIRKPEGPETVVNLGVGLSF
jgi:hypothetical protein